MDINISILSYLKSIILLCEGTLSKANTKKISFFKKSKKIFFSVTLDSIKIHNVTYEYIKRLTNEQKKFLIESYSKLSIGCVSRFFTETEFNIFKELHKMMNEEFDSYLKSIEINSTKI